LIGATPTERDCGSAGDGSGLASTWSPLVEPARGPLRFLRCSRVRAGNAQEVYLDSVLDMGSRRIVGFAMSEHHDTECAYGALAMAVAVRGGPEAITGVIFQSRSG
jgi:hypothetical protein